MSHNLKIQKVVSDIMGTANYRDADLRNPWGIAIAEDDTLWVANNGSNELTHYNFKGQKLSPDSVSLPFIMDDTSIKQDPTGLIINTSKGFVISNNNDIASTASSLLITCTEEGNIYGYNPDVNTTQAYPLVLTTGITRPGYTGLAQVQDRLYVADFSGGKIDVYDAYLKDGNNLRLLNPDSIANPETTQFPFHDGTMQANYSPFNIAHFGNCLYVTYAYFAGATGDESLGTLDLTSDKPGHGNGFINVFDFNGNFIKRFYSNGNLNSPWGMVMAPDHFVDCAGKLLVGNHGDGVINLFDRNGIHCGTLKRQHDNISYDGLWGLAKHHNSIFFSAGPAIVNTNGIIVNYDGLIGRVKSEND